GDYQRAYLAYRARPGVATLTNLMRWGFIDDPTSPTPTQWYSEAHLQPAAVILAAPDCDWIEAALPALPRGHFSSEVLEGLARGDVPHPETLYLAIDMRRPVKEIRQDVDQAIAKWRAVYETAPKYRAVPNRPRGHLDTNYMRVYDLRVMERRKWGDIGK